MIFCLHPHEKQEAVNEDRLGNGVLEAVAGEDACSQEEDAMQGQPPGHRH